MVSGISCWYSLLNSSAGNFREIIQRRAAGFGADFVDDFFAQQYVIVQP